MPQTKNETLGIDWMKTYWGRDKTATILKNGIFKLIFLYENGCITIQI